MKYEKPDVEVIMTDEEDIVTLSQPTVEEDDPNEKWSPFF